MGFYKGTVAVEMFTMVTLSLVLNLYWFYLMVRMVMRLVKRLYAEPEDDINREDI